MDDDGNLAPGCFGAVVVVLVLVVAGFCYSVSRAVDGWGAATMTSAAASVDVAGINANRDIVINRDDNATAITINRENNSTSIALNRDNNATAITIAGLNSDAIVDREWGKTLRVFLVVFFGLAFFVLVVFLAWALVQRYAPPKRYTYDAARDWGYTRPARDNGINTGVTNV